MEHAAMRLFKVKAIEADVDLDTLPRALTYDRVWDEHDIGAAVTAACTAGYSITISY